MNADIAINAGNANNAGIEEKDKQIFRNIFKFSNHQIFKLLRI
jgi:hypothetical protein